ncbi:glucosaminidase domain-containing protein [Stackebrandtia soli]|uniref:glucosaminidase domain-containing protein n=1 Tax=Stackebrandtia soli TaxID=1892856 RepID=UPI0039ECD2A7
MRQRIIAILIAIVAALAVTGTATASASKAEQQRFIEDAGRNVAPSQEKYGVPASVAVAQAILESGWGKSDLASGSRNLFGMKCKDRKPGPIATDCVKLPTSECDKSGCWKTHAWFRVYDKVEDSFADHGLYLSTNERYAKAFDHTADADRFIVEVHRAGYATDPKYADKIIKLMNQYDLYRFNSTESRV